MGSRQTEWSWKDELVILCHLTEHLHISSAISYVIINISRFSEELIYHWCTEFFKITSH